MGHYLRIGAVARLSGCSVETIRYYEKIGLIAAPRRTANGYRGYTPAALSQLQFIRHARALGFDLSTIRELLTLARDPEADCREADRIASRHLERVESHIASLQRLADELRTLVKQCRGQRIAECRIIEALNHDHPSDFSPCMGLIAHK